MKTHKLPILLITVLTLMVSCGKPNDPETPDISGNYKIIKKFATPGFAQDLVMKDALLYIPQGEGGLLIVDVTNPADPEIVSQLTEDVRGYSTKICMKDSVVYLSAGSFGVTVINVSNPDTPFVTVSNLNMKPAKNLHIFGNYLLTAISEQGIKVSEISYPEQPDIRGSISTYGYATGLTTSADTTELFVACGEMGLSIFDISNFQDGYPETILSGWCDTPGYAEDVVLDESASLAYVASGDGGLQIIDYSNLSAIHVAGSFVNGGYARELIVEGQRVYMTTQKEGLIILDVSDVSRPKLIGTVKTEYARGIVTDDRYIYLADEVEGLIVIEKP